MPHEMCAQHNNLFFNLIYSRNKSLCIIKYAYMRILIKYILYINHDKLLHTNIDFYEKSLIFFKETKWKKISYNFECGKEYYSSVSSMLISYIVLICYYRRNENERNLLSRGKNNLSLSYFSIKIYFLSFLFD